MAFWLIPPRYAARASAREMGAVGVTTTVPDVVRDVVREKLSGTRARLLLDDARRQPASRNRKRYTMNTSAHHIDHTPTNGRRNFVRALVAGGIIGLAIVGPLAGVSSAETPLVPHGGLDIATPTTVPPTEPPADPPVDPVIEPAAEDFATPTTPPDPDPAPVPQGPDSLATPPVGPDPDPTPADGPDDLTTGAVPPTTDPTPDPGTDAEPDAEPEVDSGAAGDVTGGLPVTGGGGPEALLLLGAGLAAAGVAAVGAAARRRRA
jgi:hypothetical protein